jgi:hypothetical protein
MDRAEGCTDLPLSDLPKAGLLTPGMISSGGTSGAKSRGGKGERSKGGSGGGGKVAGHDLKFWATVRPTITFCLHIHHESPPPLKRAYQTNYKSTRARAS